MNIDKYLDKNGLTPNDVVELLRPEFPKFSKSTLSMCKRETYGVTLSSKAVGVLNAAHPLKKENRQKQHKLTVRLDDETFIRMQEICQASGATVQKFVEDAIQYFLIDIRNLFKELEKELENESRN